MPAPGVAGRVNTSNHENHCDSAPLRLCVDATAFSKVNRSDYTQSRQGELPDGAELRHTKLKIKKGRLEKPSLDVEFRGI